MAKYLVKRVMEFSKVIEANSKEEAIEEFGDLNADTKLIKEKATKIKERKGNPSGKLTYQKRKRMRSSSFALEKERKYPIHDLPHARNALARVVQHGTRAEIKEVRREVYARYPRLRLEITPKTKMHRRSVRITPKRPRIR